jgi:hypothetical protein
MFIDYKDAMIRNWECETLWRCYENTRIGSKECEISVIESYVIRLRLGITEECS